MAKKLSAKGFELQGGTRKIYLTAMPGHWLLAHSTPSWRLKDPKKGFQRIVKAERAQKIAITVLDQQRTFPNAIVLATDRMEFQANDGQLEIPANSKFLVVDGQHRLWAQTYSSFEAVYGCVVHMGLTVVEMAKLFLEINDNQKRVPSSLRWDLVRLVRPENDPFAVEAAELVYALATEEGSPLRHRIDLTGEVPQLPLSQGSLAPEIRNVVSTRVARLRDLDYEKHYDILSRYLAALRAVDQDGWRSGQSPFLRNRVMRILLRIVPTLIKEIGGAAEKISAATYREYVDRIDREELAPEEIRASQGSAGMKEIYEVVKRQMLP
jgi:DGQHR domain-containing protein